MLYSVGMEQKWLPSELDCLFLDDQDHFGLEYWYENIKRYSKEIKDSVKGKN